MISEKIFSHGSVRAEALPQFMEAPAGLKREALPCTELGIYPDADKK